MATPQQPARAEPAEQQARRIVEEFLDASMAPDPDRARTYMAPDVVIVFTGGRRFDDPAQSTAFNAARYRWVKKRIERTDVVAGGTDDETIVYNIGTLYGEWPDGQPFSGNRYTDRFVVRQGRIVRMDVLNDSAEMLLVRAGLAKP
ncbi:MAG TPA: nuclear transport factor 2 family protein [Casimicrobiaceae bacterium]